MVKDMRMAFRDWPATFQGEVLDLSSSPESTARIIQDCDKKYGPISHMYVLAGCPNNQNRRNPHWGMVRSLLFSAECVLKSMSRIRPSTWLRLMSWESSLSFCPCTNA